LKHHLKNNEPRLSCQLLFFLNFASEGIGMWEKNVEKTYIA